jgi:hypothetical protein
MGYQSQLGFKIETTYGTAVTVDRKLVFVNESLKKTGVIVEREGLRGFLDEIAEDTRTGPYTVAGQIILEPNPEDLAALLPWLLAPGWVSGTQFDLADTQKSATIVIDRVAKVFTYAGCLVNRVTFSGAPGGMIRVVIDIIGQSEAVGNAGTFPSLTAGVTQPYMFNDLVLTLLTSVVKKCRSFELSVDFGLQPRLMNDTTIDSAPKSQQRITLNVELPYAAGTGTSGNTDLYEQALAGAPGSLVLANAGYSTTFAFATLQVPAESPTAQGRTEIPLTLNMVAKRLSTTRPMVITHDSTP